MAALQTNFSVAYRPNCTGVYKCCVCQVNKRDLILIIILSTLSYVLFCPPDSSKLKDIQFIIIEDKTKDYSH